MSISLLKPGVAAALVIVSLSGCAVVRVADTAVDTAVFAGTTVVRGAAAGGRLITGTGAQDDCEERRRRRC